MSKKNAGSIGVLLVKVALGLLLVIGGIYALQDHRGDQAVMWLKEQANILGVVFGVIELIAGIFLLLSFFIGDKLGQIGVILNWVIVIVFAIVIILADVIKGNWNHDFIASLYALAKDLVPLGAMLCLLI